MLIKMEGEKQNRTGKASKRLDSGIKHVQSEKDLCTEAFYPRTLIKDTINGYIFWSIFQALAPMIWFYPLNELEISGYEAFATFWLSPVLCGLPGVLTLIRNRWFLGLLRLVTVASLASFQAPDTLSRLITLASGAGVSSLVLAATLFSPSKRIRCQTFWSLMLGLFAFLASRVWFVSFVPTWWTNETNSVIIGLGFIANIDHIFSGDDKIETQPMPDPSSERKDEKIKKPNWLWAGLGLGSLLFLTHWCFSEVSLITRWVVSGFPDHGPLPDIWGIPVLVCLLLGILVSEIKDLATSPVWMLIGLAAINILYYCKTWQAYAGGLLLAIYTMSIWPRMATQASVCPPGRTLALANLVYIAECLFLVWTVAFNFVPGGVYTREHTDWLVLLVILFIVLGLKSGQVPDDYTAFAKSNGSKAPTGLHKALLVLMVVVGLLGYGYRYDPNRHQLPERANPRVFTAGIWTYHFGYDNKGWPSLERSAVLLNNTGADVITLLESDASKPFLGNNDLGMWLGERLGMYVDFGPSTRDHTWGNLILSKYPIIRSTHHLLPSPHGELAPAITATINISGEAVDFVVTHMGNDRDILDRKLQAEFLANELKSSSNPAVFLGYVTSAPGSRDYQQLIKGGGVKDIDETDKERWCEYIMYKGLIRHGYARITHGGLSDTEVQVGRFEIPADKASYKDNTLITTVPEEVDPALRFNPVFGKYRIGHGYFQHHGFHMSTPKYFLP